MVGQGDTFGEVLSDVKSAIRFHIETFGRDMLDDESASIQAVFIAEATIDA